MTENIKDARIPLKRALNSLVKAKKDVEQAAEFVEILLYKDEKAEAGSR